MVEAMTTENVTHSKPSVESGQARISRTKLLLALDALLREGSVTAAAASLDMQTSSMSRLLGELRELYGDPIFLRTGRGLRPTPFAESLRLRVRSLAEETEALFKGESRIVVSAPARDTMGEWQQRSKVAPPPLSAARAEQLEAEPTPVDIARRIAAIGDNADPHRRLAKYIALTASGAGRSRPLDFDEARDALGIILRGEADPIQIGALLMTVKYRGATAVELAGFVRAVRDVSVLSVPQDLKPDLDWPAYVSPRWRNPPWFIHAARLVAAAGYRVVLHGHFGNGSDSGKLEAAAERAAIPVCTASSEISAALAASNIAYVPLGAFAPQVNAMLNLYPLLETRSPLHHVVPLINPFDASATLVGAAGGPLRDIYRQIGKLLGMQNLAIVKSIRDFAQVTPTRTTTILRMLDGVEAKTAVPARPGIKAAGTVSSYTQSEYWQAVWSGAARDEQAELTIQYTAAAALLCLSKDPSARFEEGLDQAAELWASRKR